jgi:hypothetical protein
LTAITQVLEYDAIPLIPFAQVISRRSRGWEEEVKKLSPLLNQMYCKEATIRVAGKEYEGTLI